MVALPLLAVLLLGKLPTDCELSGVNCCTEMHIDFCPFADVNQPTISPVTKTLRPGRGRKVFSHRGEFRKRQWISKVAKMFRRCSRRTYVVAPRLKTRSPLSTGMATTVAHTLTDVFRRLKHLPPYVLSEGFPGALSIPSVSKDPTRSRGLPSHILAEYMLNRRRGVPSSS